MNTNRVRITSLAIVLIALGTGSGTLFAKPTKTKMDTPTIRCGSSTQSSITLQVCAPSGANATGAPAGFSIQWMTAAAYAANGNQWLSSDDAGLCKASFSGNANLSRYNLAPGECVDVVVGEFLFDEGTSTNCDGLLTCGTTYEFRAFAHATNTLNRSDFSGNTECTTLDCGHGDTCTLTQGYWKTHGPIPTGNNSYDWPQSVKDNGLTLGTVSYTADELLAILNTPASGNGLLALAHQLIAAKLNVAAGADDADVALTIIAADGLIGGLVIPPVGSGFLSPGVTSSLTTDLTSYNEGATGPGHCDI